MFCIQKLKYKFLTFSFLIVTKTKSQEKSLKMVNNNLLLSLIQEVKPIFWYYIMPPGGNTCTAERIKCNHYIYESYGLTIPFEWWQYMISIT